MNLPHASLAVSLQNFQADQLKAGDTIHVAAFNDRKMQAGFCGRTNCNTSRLQFNLANVNAPMEPSFVQLQTCLGSQILQAHKGCGLGCTSRFIMQSQMDLICLWSTVTNHSAHGIFVGTPIVSAWKLPCPVHKLGINRVAAASLLVDAKACFADHKDGCWE